MKLSGKVVVITGASAGVGRAASLLFSQEGASVILVDIDELGGRAVEDEVTNQGGEALFLRTDITSDEAVRSSVQAGAHQFGSINVLFNCAGGSSTHDGPVTSTSTEVWHHALGVDLLGTVNCCRHAIPHIVESGGGAVVNVSSIVALRGTHALHAYASAKGAILSLTRSLAGEYGPLGVRANCISPGVVLSERIEARLGDRDKILDAQPAKGAMDLSRHPFAIGRPIDIARIALFLASDDARMINGANIPAEGGLSAY